jgi:hypothetical protein
VPVKIKGSDLLLNPESSDLFKRSELSVFG